MSQAPDVTAATKAAAAHELDEGLRMIDHCVGQLADEQLWWRPAPSMNSTANLILHLCGNVGQWLAAGLGGAEDTRDRPREFTERGPIGKAELLSRLHTAVEQAKAAIAAASDEDLTRRRQIQRFEVTGIGAVFHSVAHFKGHVQEIVHLTRMQLGDDYQFDFVPTSSSPDTR